MSIVDTLQERHKTHGSFESNANIAQTLRNFYRSLPGWHDLDHVMKESLDQDAGKKSRILSGGGRHIDNWHDTAGYATLVEKWLKGEVL
jgi:hypothetical protein